MSGVATAIGVSTISGAAIGAAAAGNAADKQAAASQYATDLQEKMYYQNRSDNAPWNDAGNKALAGLSNPDFQKDFTAADFQKDPGYEFRMQEGQKALERSAAARGGLQSGGTMKAIGRYGQDYASNEYNNAYNRFNTDRTTRFNRLSSLAGVGQTANAQVASAGENYANQAGQNVMGSANAQGAAGMAKANAWGGAMNNGANNWMQLSMMNRMFPSQDGGFSNGQVQEGADKFVSGIGYGG